MRKFAGYSTQDIAGARLPGDASSVEKEIITEEIGAYAAVALAGLGWLPDTILMRSVIIRMRRRHQGEHVEPFRRLIHAPEGAEIRDTIETWARAQPSTIEWPELPPQIQDRDADVWEPSIAVADLVGGEWPARARIAAVALVAESKEVEASLGIRLLGDLRTVFGNHTEMTSKQIINALLVLEESPWSDIRGKALGRARGGAPAAAVSGAINQSRYRRREAEGLPPRGPSRTGTGRRYLPPSPATAATTATTATNQPFSAHWRGSVADVADLSGYGGEPR